MRTVRARAARVAALVVLSAALLGGCELREGVSSEYGGMGRQPPQDCQERHASGMAAIVTGNFDKWTQIRSE